MCRWGKYPTICHLTSEILTNYLKHIDKYLNLDRYVATPSLQMVGYGSWFEKIFLRYINPVSENDGKKWKVILGLPYGTSIWQTGDARSENGQY